MIYRSKFPKASESRLIRFVREDRNRRSPWIPVGSMSDQELAQRGALLASPEIDRGALEEQGEDDTLVWLLDGGGEKGVRDEQIAKLLEQCPRTNYLPPLDLDVAEGFTAEAAIPWMQKLDPVVQAVGLGRPSWHFTGGKGIHGDLLAPKGFADTNLLDIARVLVLEAARQVGIPLLSDHPSKDQRPPVVLDDRLFRRNPDSRGVVWRLTSAEKPGKGFKTPIDLAGRVVDYVPPVPGDLEAFNRAKAFLDHQDRLSGHGKCSHRKQKPVAPVVLPEGTTHLASFAATLKRVLAARNAWHDTRLACAGWLLRLGVAAPVVEATLSLATDNQEDARSAVETTVKRLAADRPTSGLNWLRSQLGGPECVELVDALERDGVHAPPKKNLLDAERRLMMRVAKHMPHDHPGRMALIRGARCQTLAMPYECEDHGPQGVRLNVEERELVCPHCREQRCAAIREVLGNTWNRENYGVLVIRANVAAKDRLRALREARIAGKRLVSTNWRWFMGHDHVMFVFSIAAEADALAARIKRLVASDPKSLDKRDQLARAAVLAQGVTPEDARVVSKSEALAVVCDTWRQPGVAFQRVLELGDEQAIASFSWLQKKNVNRTASDKNARESLAWPSKEKIRSVAKSRAISARGGIDPTLCDQENGIDDFGRPIPCCKPYRVFLDHVITGVRLRHQPYVGRFPRSHEIHLALDCADPDELKSGYEQQRALGRRR